MKVSISGLQAVQSAMLRAIAAMQASGALGEAVRHVVAGVHRYAVQNTVVDTGSWRASHRMQISGLRGRVDIDPSAQNPVRGGYPAVYGAVLERRKGGRYAVYRNTFEQAGPELLRQADAIIRGGLD